MYGCENWTIKKAQNQRIDDFKLWCWKRLTGPWTAKQSNQSIVREINPEYWLEGMMLKLKLQYFGHLIWRAKSLEKSLMLGKIEGRRIRGQRDEMDGWHHQCKGHELGQTLGDGEQWGDLECCSTWCPKELDTTEWLNKNNIILLQGSSVQFSHSVMSNSLWIHELQHARLSCPSLTPGACSNSCALSWWCHPPSHHLWSTFHPAFNLSQHQGLFQWVSSSYQVPKILEFKLWHQSFQWIFRVDFL